MTFDDYQKLAHATAVYPDVMVNGNEINWVYPLIGLQGELGECAEKLKKILRDNGGIITEEMRGSIRKEGGDLTWYLSELFTSLGFSFNEVAKENLEKLASRKERDKIHGSGDDR